jgi:diketogulonate reductase-like aldo/keto reductase
MEYVTVQGTAVPALGLGTWRMSGETCREAVETGLELGYRHVDTAQVYGNERQVGEAIAASDVDRDEVFLTTKLDVGNRRYDDVIASLERSLAKLRTSYVDLLLIHNPIQRIPLAETLDAMSELVERGQARHVGVSNFDVDRLDRARRHSDEAVFTNQVQFNPYWPQRELLDYCAIHEVLLTAYSPLAHGQVATDATLQSVGRRHGKSATQVALRWVLDHENVAAVAKASSREHLAENLDVFDFELTDAEAERVRQPSKTRAMWGFVRGRLPV